jgi:hypothetical protein
VTQTRGALSNRKRCVCVARARDAVMPKDKAEKREEPKVCVCAPLETKRHLFDWHTRLCPHQGMDDLGFNSLPHRPAGPLVLAQEPSCCDQMHVNVP